MASDMPPDERPTDAQQQWGWPGQLPPSPGPYPGYPPYQFAPPMQTAEKRGGVPWYVWLIGGCLGLVIIVIVGCVVLVGVFAGLGLKALNLQSATDTSTQTLQVKGVPTLDIQDGAGQITITQGSSDQVSVQITRTARASSEQDAQTGLQGIVANVTRQGNTITISTNVTSSASNLLFDSREVDLTISTPHQTQVTVTGTSGSVEVDQISGQMDLSMNVGQITTSGVTFADGSRVELQTGDATLQGALAPGASVDVQVVAGNVGLTLPANTSAHFNASVNYGTIAIDGWPITPVHPSGNTSGMTASGALGPNPTGSITVQVNDGDITLTAG